MPPPATGPQLAPIMTPELQEEVSRIVAELCVPPVDPGEAGELKGVPLQQRLLIGLDVQRRMALFQRLGELGVSNFGRTPNLAGPALTLGAAGGRGPSELRGAELQPPPPLPAVSDGVLENFTTDFSGVAASIPHRERTGGDEGEAPPRPPEHAPSRAPPGGHAAPPVVRGDESEEAQEEELYTGPPRNLKEMLAEHDTPEVSDLPLPVPHPAPLRSGRLRGSANFGGRFAPPLEEPLFSDGSPDSAESALEWEGETQDYEN